MIENWVRSLRRDHISGEAPESFGGSDPGDAFERRG